MQPQQSSGNKYNQEQVPKKSYPYWLWISLIAILVLLVLGINSWNSPRPSFATQNKPFFQVTNRELSIFLWQFPKYMRANVPYKTNYLPGFQYEEKFSMFPEYADNYVVANPEVLFQYHVWSRLIKDEWSERPIPLSEFKEFIDYAPEWLPHFWGQAPQGYVKFMDNLANEKEMDLQALSDTILPKMVRQSFQGWKNFVKEGNAIDKLKPTVEQARQFIERYPHYARNYWWNVVKNVKPAYLQSLDSNNIQPNALLASEEISDFLLVAIYNYLHASQMKP
jgi:hypothetical protein